MSHKLDNPQLIPKTDRISVIIAPFDSSGKIRATIIGDVDQFRMKVSLEENILWRAGTTTESKVDESAWDLRHVF